MRRMQDLSETLVSGWVELIADQLVREGWAPQVAEPVATLVLAQFRGLQLDLLVAGDRGRVDRAFQSSLRLLQPPDPVRPAGRS
jgi:hypothetical protein